MLNSWGSSGAVSSLMNTAGFILPFYDKGSGEVDLVPYRGTGSATFTRATTATTVNSSGTIISVASGVARSYYDPTTLQYRHFLSEPARTNLLLNATIDGANLATQDVTVTNVAHTISFYGTGTITLSGTSTAGPLVGTGNYPARVSLTLTPTAGTLTVTVSGDVKYANLEIGSYASTFIPTAGTAVTRNADVLTYPFAGNADATQGTCVAEARSNSTTATTPASASLVGFANNGLGFGFSSSAAYTTFTGYDGTNIVIKTGLSDLRTATRKRAVSWGVAGLLVTGDGLAPQSGSFGGSIGNTAIGIGIEGDGTGAEWGGTIGPVYIWTTQFSAAQLQAITA